MANDKKEEAIERSKITLVGFENDDVRYEAVKRIAELLDISFDEATDLADAAPVDILPSAPTEAAELLGERLQEGGAIVAVLPLGPVYRYCETHPHRRARGRCKTCEIYVCDKCLINSHGRLYCPEHYEIFRQKRTLRWVGGTFIGLLVLFVALFFSQPLIRAWRLHTPMRDVKILVIFASQDPQNKSEFYLKNISPSSADGYAEGDAHTIADIAPWLNREYRRVTGRTDIVPFTLTAYGFYKIPIEPPPAPIEGGSYVSLQMKSAYRAFFENEVIRQTGVDGSKFNVVLLVDLEDDSKVDQDFMEGLGSAMPGYAYVRLPVTNVRYPNDYYIAAAAHYVVRALGARSKLTDKGFPKNPEGLANPLQNPPYAQSQAEISAGYRAVQEYSIDRPATLDAYVIGPLTAYEIGWLSKNMVDDYYPESAFQ